MPAQSFNKKPYFDSYAPESGFQKILFRPGRTIQVRELNELSSIMEQKTSTISDHLFKFGSVVKSGSIRYNDAVNYVRLKDLTPTGDPVDLKFLINHTIRGITSGLVAQILNKSEKDQFDPPTVYVNYQNSAVDGVTQTFVNGETLEIIDAAGYPIYQVTVRCPTCPNTTDNDTKEPTGFGTAFSVEPSTYYVFGHFVTVGYQTLILSKYTIRPSFKVGFDIIQNVVTAQTDQSLNDNALGSPNFSAPGADRYKINLVLNKKHLESVDDENFVMLARINVGVLQELRDKPQYAELMTTLARRTHDESGDYTVKPYTINFKEHLITGNNTNLGFKTAAEGGSIDKFAIMVSAGKSYVRGREVEHISESVVEADKARDSATRRSAVIRPESGNYVKIELGDISSCIPCKDVGGTVTAMDYNLISIYDAEVNSGVITGNVVGKMRAKAIELDSGIIGTSGGTAPVWRLYIFDLEMFGSNTIIDALGFYSGGGGNQTFSGNFHLDPIDSTTKIYEPQHNNLLYRIPFNFVSSIRDADNPLVANTSITLIKKFTGSITAAGTVTWSNGSNETFMSYRPNRTLGGIQDPATLNYVPFSLSGKITTSPTSVTVDAGVANVGKDFVLITEVMITGVKEKTKTLNNYIANGVDGALRDIDLTINDAYRIVSVTDTTNANAANHFDVTDQYDLDAGHKDNYYANSFIKMKSAYITPLAGTSLDIVVEYFVHSGTGNFFSVDSYTGLINDPMFDFDYEDIPTYVTSNGEEYPLSDTIDFRQATGTNNEFGVGGAGASDIPVKSSNIIFDLQYYLPRTDILVVDDLGALSIVKGIPDDKPYPPKIPENSMSIYTIFIQPYTFAIETDIKAQYVDNKRYTMRDIGKLERRIGNLEYYVSFNLLEKSTSDMEILDANGNNRFKNGFLVDNFKTYRGGQVDSPEFRCAIDTVKGELRPGFKAINVPMELNAAQSSQYTLSGELYTLPFLEELYQDQVYSSKTISVNPYFIYEQVGNLELSPNLDVWRSDVAPRVVTGEDSGFERLNDIQPNSSVLSTDFSSWSGSRSRGTTTETIETTVESSIRVSSNSISEVNIIPYIRSSEVQFGGSNMKPRTKVYCFFDDTDVTMDCRPLNGAKGEDIFTDLDGNVTGTFVIPNTPEKRFFVGVRIFKLTNSATNSDDRDEVTTTASAQFYGGGLENVKSSERSIETQVSTTRETSFTRTPNRPQAWVRSGDDPLAQSFSVDDPKGVFLTSIDLYFSAKNDKIPVWFQVRNMVNGYPGPIIVEYSEVTKNPASVNISDDASVATSFSFMSPVYLAPDDEYCFVVGSSSEDYRIHVSKLGGPDILTGATISSQPHIGSMFKSQNDSTWSAEQYEDIKFVMKRAKFDTSSEMSLTLNNSPRSIKASLRGNPMETETGTNLVRIYQENHGLVPNDKVRIDMAGDRWYMLHLVSGKISAGSTITGQTNGGTAVIKDIVYQGGVVGATAFKVLLDDFVGAFDLNENIQSNGTMEAFRNPELLTSLGIIPVNVPIVIASGKIVDLGTLPGDINGIPLDELTLAHHVVQDVDSIDSYIIHTISNATGTGRTGGKGLTAVGNIQVDSFNFDLVYMDHKGETSWEYTGISHSTLGGTISDYIPQKSQFFEIGNTIELNESNKVANSLNEGQFLGANKSVKIECKLGSDTDFISPTVKRDSLAFTAIRNRVDFNVPDNFNVAPNATNRWVDEESSIGTVEPSKYIMNPVNLSNPASNIQVYMDVLKPINTLVQVYARTLPVDVEDDIQNLPWVLYEFNDDVVAEHNDDYREVEISIPGVGPVELPEFKAFQVKLVMKSKNSAKPPKVRQFRAVAVL